MDKISTYFKLWCGHIQMRRVEGVKYGETRVYCRQCEDLRTVLKMSRSRFD
jgi:hypothetical protein